MEASARCPLEMDEHPTAHQVSAMPDCDEAMQAVMQAEPCEHCNKEDTTPTKQASKCQAHCVYCYTPPGLTAPVSPALPTSGERQEYAPLLQTFHSYTPDPQHGPPRPLS